MVWEDIEGHPQWIPGAVLAGTAMITREHHRRPDLGDEDDLSPSLFLLLFGVFNVSSRK